MKKVYDAAFVPCKEPDVTTDQFPEHHNRCLQTAWELQKAGAVGRIVLSGRYAAWYDNHGITPWFGTESDASAEYLLGLGCPPEVMLKEKRSQDSVANLVYSAQDIFIPEGMKSVLLVTADERAGRLDFLCKHLLAGVVKVDVESVGPSNDPWLAQKEPFTLAVTQEYFKNVPKGTAGWPVLESWFYQGGMYEFWTRFDAAHQAMPTPAESHTWSIPDIVASMDTKDLPQDIVEFANAAARGLATASQ